MPTLKYIIDDGGDNTNGLTWATAFRSVPDRIAAFAIGADDLDVIGHDSVDAYAYGANHTVVSRTNKPGWHLVSVTQGVGSIAGGIGSFTYQRSTSLQINPAHTTASYTLTIDGAHALFGVSLGGNIIVISMDNDEGVLRHAECHYKPTDGGRVNLTGVHAQRSILQNPIFDGALTVTPNTTALLRLTKDNTEVNGGSCVNMAKRSVFVDDASGALTSSINVRGMDFNTTWATVFSPVFASANSTFQADFSNCKMPSSWTPYANGFSAYPSSQYTYANCGNADTPTGLIRVTRNVQAWTTPLIYRTGGGSFESVPCSWGGPTLGILTSTRAQRDEPVLLPWVPVYFASTGVKAITAYYASNTALGRPYYAEELAISILYPATSGSSLLTRLSSEPIRTIEASTTLHSDDTSVWVGDTFTYQRKIEVPVTIGKIGLGYVCWVLMKESIAASDDTYLDPQFTVT